MSALPSDTLRNRTFIALLIAQFLAAFNDQAIHASAMFFAIDRKTLTEANAITLMPLLFYAPWALFATLAGYFADRFPKRTSLVFWKLAEVGITAVATLGFWLGVHGSSGGAWIVLSSVFLMGTHSAFFVPAKYGAMPEILQPQLLSRGNGILESLSFLAVILGTVFGGILSDLFDDFNHQYYIGFILFGLAIVGVIASLYIQPTTAANPRRPFPPYIYGPIVASIKVLFRSRPLAMATIGIAFFTFMVAFMRSTVYMLGESQVERWSESYTSIVVGTTALGIGLGSPLAGWLSGRKVELGLVPLGAIGMALAAGCAALFVDNVTCLVGSIIVIGFFTGFYLVPLFTLLQHRAPKASKGDAVATSNFVNVTGAILAAILFRVLVAVFQFMGLARPIDIQKEFIVGPLTAVTMADGRPETIVVGDRTLPPKDEIAVIKFSSKVPTAVDSTGPREVIVDTYARHKHHYLVRMPGEKPETVYDKSRLPRYLFLGAGLTALLTLGMLWREMPDLFSRAMWVLRAARMTRNLHAVGTHFLPGDGPTVLVTNCRDETSRRNVVAATERTVRFVQTKLTDDALAVELRAVQSGAVLALTADAEVLLPILQSRLPATYLPVYHGPALVGEGAMRVAFGPPLPPDVSPEAVAAAIRAAASLPEEEVE
jgi:MFS family permease